jgi:hypothetical protein
MAAWFIAEPFAFFFCCSGQHSKLSEYVFCIQSCPLRIICIFINRCWEKSLTRSIFVYLVPRDELILRETISGIIVILVWVKFMIICCHSPRSV